MGYIITTTNGELYHHGIKGQKWGVRRYQNEDGSLTEAGMKRYGTVGIDAKVTKKDIKTERDRAIDKYMEQDPRQKKLRVYEKQIDHLVDNYEFDGDDGGGGLTDADREAGAKYMKLWEKHGKLEDEIRYSATKKVSDELLNKYGEKRMSDLKRSENIQAAAATTLVVAAGVSYTAALVTHPIITVGATAVGLAGSLRYATKKSRKE